MQTPFKWDIWLQSYEEFVNAKNKIKQKDLNTVLATISRPIFPDIRFIPLDHVTYVLVAPINVYTARLLL